MAEHREKTVIDAFVSEITGLATAGANVELERNFQWPSGTVSAIEVEIGRNDPLDDSDQSWPSVYSWAELAVTLIYSGKKSDALKYISAMRAEINIQLMSFHTSGELPLGLSFVSDIMEYAVGEFVTDELDETQTRRTVYWRVKYNRNELNPTE